MTSRRVASVVCALAVVTASGCYAVNPRLPRLPVGQPQDQGPCRSDEEQSVVAERPSDGRACQVENRAPICPYRFRNLGDPETQDANDETFIALAFSGGGTRAAAFSYGVMEALEATSLGDGRTLLDEVDVISSVSGGSFTAAYYGLFGKERFFHLFRNDVLDRDIESDLIGRIAAPWNWPPLLSPYYGRSDLAAEYYDDAIFEGCTFRDMPRRRPFIVLNATDIGMGAQFSFTQDQFDPICSDLDGVPVARAVTASSAFPVAFTPLTVKNYGAGACNYDPPLWVNGAEANDFDLNPLRFDLARTWRSYEDAITRPYIHLSDGGLADNIGLRAIETGIWWTKTIPLLDRINNSDKPIKRLVIIVVDAKPRAPASADLSARPPGIFTVLNAAATNPMENYSADTVELTRLKFDQWDKDARQFEASPAAAAGSRFPKPDELYLINLRFDAIPDESAKRVLQNVDTRLQLSSAEVDLLVSWGRRLLLGSDDFKKLVEESLGGTIPSMSASGDCCG